MPAQPKVSLQRKDCCCRKGCNRVLRMVVYTADEIKKQLKYLTLLAKEYPTIQSACTEIINLQAILQLPKGTEHFMSDLHGEYQSFTHILNNCSGVIKTKIDSLLSKSISQQERAEIASLIYYPQTSQNSPSAGLIVPQREQRNSPLPSTFWRSFSNRSLSRSALGLYAWSVPCCA